MGLPELSQDQREDSVDLIAALLSEADELRKMLSDSGLRVTGQPPLPIVQGLIERAKPRIEEEKVIAVIKNGQQILYSEQGERLNYLARTVIVDSPEHKECEFEMLVDGDLGTPELPQWTTEKHEKYDGIYYLVSPLGVKHAFSRLFVPFQVNDETRVQIQCAVELRNEPPKAE